MRDLVLERESLFENEHEEDDFAPPGFFKFQRSAGN